MQDFVYETNIVITGAPGTAAAFAALGRTWILGALRCVMRSRRSLWQVSRKFVPACDAIRVALLIVCQKMAALWIDDDNLMDDLPKITLLSLQICQSPNSRLSGHSLAFATGAPDTDRNISLRFWLVQHRVRSKCLIIISPMRMLHECARQSTIRLWRDSLHGWIL